MSLSAADGAQRVFGNTVSANYFSSLGVRPAAGRLFDVDGTVRLKPDTRRSSVVSGFSQTLPPIVLSHALWTRRLDRDQSIVGRTVQGVRPRGENATGSDTL